MIEPYYADDRVTLYHGDALAVLADLPDASIDAVITDPPYSSGGMYRGDRAQQVHTKYVQSEQQQRGTGGARLAAFSGDGRDQRGYAHWCALWLAECLRIVRPGGACALFSDWRQLPTTTDALQAGGFVWRGVVPWHKPAGRPTQGRYGNTCEYVAWGTKGARDLDILGGRALPGFYQSNPPRDRDRDHITQKPLDVMRQLVHIAPKGGTILDPFAGAGTTGVAAVLEGRNIIAAEIVEHYAQIAADNITAAARGYRDDGVQLVIGQEADQ